MRYKFKIYTNEEYFLINSAKFSIIIYFDINREMIIKHKTMHTDNYNELNDIDLLFDIDKKTSFITNLQKLKYFLNYIKEDPMRDYYSECRILGIDINYTFKKDDSIKVRLNAIINHMLNKYNPENEEFFKYDLNNKEFIKYLLNLDFDLLYKIMPDKFKNDEEIIEVILKQNYYIKNTEIFETSKERIIKFLNSNLRGQLKINHKLVDKELIQIFKEKNVIYERIDKNEIV